MNIEHHQITITKLITNLILQIVQNMSTLNIKKKQHGIIQCVFI